MGATVLKQARFKILLELDELETAMLLDLLMEYGKGDVMGIFEMIMEAFDEAGIEVNFDKE